MYSPRKNLKRKGAQGSDVIQVIADVCIVPWRRPAAENFNGLEETP